MGILSRAGDFAYTLRFLRLLTTKWEDTNAFKLGLIDNKGKKLRNPESSEEKSAYNYFHRLVFNLKKLLNKAPGGKSVLGSYIAALYLIKEEGNLGGSALDRIIKECGIDPVDYLLEEGEWFTLRDGMLSPGEYRLNHGDKILNSTAENLCRKGDRIHVEMDNYPVGDIMGVNVYEVVHVPTNNKIYITTGELKR